MRARLLDINILVALAWPNHVHHDRAVDWFTAHHDEGWATCSFTETGFVRVSSNARVVPEARSPREAIRLLRELVAIPGHEFWSDDVPFTNTEFIDERRVIGHRQVTDAHLVSLALRHAGQLATFDRRIAEVLPGAAPDDCLLMVP